MSKKTSPIFLLFTCFFFLSEILIFAVAPFTLQLLVLIEGMDSNETDSHSSEAAFIDDSPFIVHDPEAFNSSRSLSFEPSSFSQPVIGTNTTATQQPQPPFITPAQGDVDHSLQHRSMSDSSSISGTFIFQ